MTVRELNDRLQTLDIDDLVRQAIEANASKLVTMNRRQMEEGKTREGDLIEPLYRSVIYARGKKELYGSKAPFRVPDLKLTGEFHKGMVLEVDDRDYYLYSTDEKAGMLAEKYKNIFGLSDENKQAAKVINTRTLGAMYKKAAGLK